MWYWTYPAFACAISVRTSRSWSCICSPFTKSIIWEEICNPISTSTHSKATTYLLKSQEQCTLNVNVRDWLIQWQQQVLLHEWMRVLCDTSNHTGEEERIVEWVLGELIETREQSAQEQTLKELVLHLRTRFNFARVRLLAQTRLHDGIVVPLQHVTQT